MWLNSYHILYMDNDNRLLKKNESNTCVNQQINLLCLRLWFFSSLFAVSG